MKIFQPIVTGSLSTSGSVFFPSLVTSSTTVSNVVMFGTSGQLFVTASSAIGGAGSGFPFSGSAVITGSLLVSGSGLIVTGSVGVLGSSQFRGNIVITGSVLINGGPLDLGIAEFNSTSSVTTTGAVVVSSINTGSATSAFYNYTIASASNARSGQVMSVWNGTTIRFTEVTTTDIGNTNSALFAVGISGANVQLQFTSSGVWTVKSIANLI